MGHCASMGKSLYWRLPRSLLRTPLHSLQGNKQMPSVSVVLSSVIMTALGVAVIFRIDMLRGLVTGIQTADSTGKAPANTRALYM